MVVKTTSPRSLAFVKTGQWAGLFYKMRTINVTPCYVKTYVKWPPRIDVTPYVATTYDEKKHSSGTLTRADTYGIMGIRKCSAGIDLGNKTWA